MEVIIHSIVWSVDTEILRNGNGDNALRNHSINDRLRLLRSVVDEAYALGTTAWRLEPIEERTKLMFLVFTAPEYLFAYSDRQHLITEEQKQEVVRTLQAISNEYPLMVMIPGTIAWKKPLVRGGAKRYHGGDPKKPKTVSRFDKFAHRMAVDEETLLQTVPDFVQRTINNAPSLNMKQYYFGRKEEMKQERAEDIHRDATRAVTQVDKNWMTEPERCYLARNTAYAFHAGREVGRYHKRGNFNEVYASESDGGYVVFMPGGTGPGKGDRFTVGGIRFGIEVCADHEAGYFAIGGGQLPHLHVVLSAKVRLDPTHAAMVPGGYLIHACSDVALSGVLEHKSTGGHPIDPIDSDRNNSQTLGTLLYNRLVIDTDT